VGSSEVHRYVALRDEKEVRRNVKTRINKINDDGVMFGSFLTTTLRIINILHIAKAIHNYIQTYS
jgi:hypothetical protein